ncbi:transmembrane and immunoglobulin domain-containing protein 2-like [Neolamprologus brichardi]|uniref:transmembrane and immunoglobulin domain-containing protein 2-like n=1 Tax=Neolamprologus brichardi TaxID=32507 RepID=UPI001643BC2B|nr:transmembrane and immunoglobulin domain-containing protein 2-like [Neolamprologus brichardi]
MKLVLRSLLLTSFCTISSWTVVYAVGISVVTQSPDVSVMEGETVSITCCWTRPFERFRVNWLKNQTVFRSETYANQSPESLKLEAKTCSSLNISNIRTEDSGTYICKVTVELPSLAEAKGNGTFITVREKTNDTDSTPSSSTVIFVLRSLPFILLLLIFCCFRKWTTSQRHRAKQQDGECVEMKKKNTEEAPRKMMKTCVKHPDLMVDEAIVMPSSSKTKEQSR